MLRNFILLIQEVAQLQVLRGDNHFKLPLQENWSPTKTWSVSKLVRWCYGTWFIQIGKLISKAFMKQMQSNLHCNKVVPNCKFF